jgi:hypothetical protein
MRPRAPRLLARGASAQRLLALGVFRCVRDAAQRILPRDEGLRPRIGAALLPR